jgi:hypothetical protein
MSGLISRWRLVPSLTKVKESRPRLRPVAILKVRGVATNVRNAGKASVKSSQRTRATARHMSAPTRIRAGTVAYVGSSEKIRGKERKVKTRSLPDRVGAGATEGCGTPRASAPPVNEKMSSEINRQVGVKIILPYRSKALL